MCCDADNAAGDRNPWLRNAVPMIWKLLTVLAGASVAWWLSGYDANLTAEDKVADRKRRLKRCGITLLLAGLGWLGGVVFIFVLLTLAIVWAPCLSELLARAFHRLIDFSDASHFDPEKLTNDLDRLAGLAKQDRNGEALQLCGELMQSGGTSPAALEAMRFRLYDRMFTDERLRCSPMIAEACQLWEKKEYGEAELQLKQLLELEPFNLPAAVLLMRIYAQALKRPDKAYGWLQALEKQSAFPPGFVAYVREHLEKWLAPAAPEAKDAGIESFLVRKG
jgi:hypothetical protein